MRRWARRGLALFLCLGMLLFSGGAFVLYPASRRAGLPVSAPAGEKLVALTFDDGPMGDTTAALLDGLSRRGVRATFFLVGQQLAGNEELVLRMEQEGHQVGIHSYHHKALAGLNKTDFYEEVGRLREELTALLGHDSFLLRPPYGTLDPQVQRLAEAPIILWSIDPEDWSDENCDRQVAVILDQVRDGSVILLHDIYPTSVDTALRVVDALLGQGYYFVTVEQLFAARGIELKPGEVYRNAY